ncbi:type II toxin-antitoxin system prevent-host-death family antitoxin [Streptomyces sp. NPDC050636]|uniref:type II toxin-antitoxin system Phd/YefM family antitoxin n=1 Tax=Streptomyces sp. NPDC050636 TaxID=3154510 RepID=UPI00343053D7
MSSNRARTGLSDLLARARWSGETTTITKAGRPIAVVVPDEWFQRAVAAIGAPGESPKSEPASDQ